MANKTYIVITFNLMEVIDFKEAKLEDDFINKQMDYNNPWFWVVKGKDISGTSGYNSFQHTMNRYPKARILTLRQYKKKLKKDN